MSGWKQYSDQEAFDLSATHLLTQMCKSTDPRDSGRCAYRGRDGCMCALGVFIPDGMVDEYQPSWHIARLCGFSYYLGDRLRKIHDEFKPNEWREELLKLAKTLKLSTGVLDNFDPSRRGEL